MASFFVKLYVT